MSGISDGAKAGAAFGPWGSAAGAAFGGLADIAGAGGGPQVLSSAVDARSFMDGSGWTVSTGSSKATGGERRDAASMLGGSTIAAPQALQAGVPWWLPAGLLLGLYLMRRGKP